MKTSRRKAVRCALAALCTTAGAVASVSAHTASEVAARLQALYPKTRITSVAPAPVDGLYAVSMGDNIAYTDAHGRYFVFGHLYDMQRQKDLTAGRQAEQRRATFPHALLANAIKTVKGNGARLLAVFSDPDCVFCRRLEGAFAQVTDVTIYTFLFPLESIHPAAKSKAISIWCAPDRSKAWSDTLLQGTAPPLTACPNPVDDNLVLGGALGVVGTPTMIAADGRVLPGAVSAAELEAWLDQGTPPRGTP